MENRRLKIIANKKIADGFYRMAVRSPYLAKHARPGQFVEVRISDSLDPLLRRPFGVHRISTSGIEMLYEVVGKGTGILSRKKPGDTVDILGPLGKGFSMDYKKSAILIAGGIGVAPLTELAAALRRRKKEVHVIIGAKKKSHILCGSEFKSLGCQVSVVTEDGSKGKKGLVTDMLKNFLTQYSIPDTQYAIYACGPNGMLKAIYDIARPEGIPCQFSFESYMACGIGVCLGCPVKVRKGLIDFEYKMICKDGPVFNGEDIAW